MLGACFGLALLLRDDVGRFVQNDVACGFHIAVHFGRDVFGAGNESLEAMKDTRPNVEGKD